MTAAGRLQELWRFREVIRNFVAQDLKVKYRRSALGFFWSLLNPLLMMAVLSAVFSTIFKWGQMEHYPLYVLSGLLPWTFFAATIDGCSVSIVNNEAYLKRQYFPKMVFPLASAGQHLVTLILSTVVLLTALGWVIGFEVSPALAVLPFSILCLAAFSLGLGLIVATVTVYFRDVQHLVQVALTAWYILSPVFWPIQMFDGQSKQLYFKFNPMYHVLDLFRAPIHRFEFPTTTKMAVAAGCAAVTLTAGLILFWKREDDLVFRL